MKDFLKKTFDYLYPYEDKRWLRVTLYFASLAFFFAYCLSIPAFSNIHPFNYISIALCGMMCASMGLYAFLYSKIKINISIGILIIFNITIILTHLINHNFSSFPKTIILMTLVSFFVYQFACTVSNKDLLFLIIGIGALCFAVVFVYYFRNDIFHLSNLFQKRLGPPFDNENEIGKEFGFFALIFFVFAFKSKKIAIKICAGLGTLLFVFLIMATGSISNLLSIILACLICSIIFVKGIKNKLIIVVSSAVVVGLFVAILQIPALSYFKTRIEGVLTTLFSFGKDVEDGSSLNRLQAALTSIRVGFSKPIFGFGYMASMDFNALNVQAHNNIAELFIDFGISGLVLFEALLILPIAYARRVKDNKFIYAISIFMVIFQLFLTTYYKKYEYVFLALIYASLDDVFEPSYVLFNSKMFNKGRKKKLIFEVIPSLAPVGGAEVFVADFIANIKKRYSDDIEIALVLLYEQEDSFLLQKMVDNGVTIYQLKKHKGLDFRCAFRLRDLVLDQNPDIIHTHLLTISTLKMAFLFKRKRIKFIHTIHHNVSNSKSEKLLLNLIKHKYLEPICVASTPAKEYSERTEMEIKYINNGVDLDKFDNSAKLVNRSYDFLAVGRFAKVKNHLELLNIIRDYFNDKNNKFVFLGEGPLLDDCKTFCDNNNLNDIVEIKGVVDNVPQYMSQSKVLVMPSLNEGNPIVINEAIASGMIVVGNDVGGIHDLLADSKFGYLANVKDHGAFADVMKKALEEANSSNEFISKDDMKKYDISYTVDSYLSIFGVL